MNAWRKVIGLTLLIISCQRLPGQDNAATSATLWIAPAANPSSWQPYPLERRSGRILKLSQTSLSFESSERGATTSTKTEIPVQRIVRIQATLPEDVQAIVDKMTGSDANVDTAKQALVAASTSTRWDRWLLLSYAAMVLADHQEYAAALEIVSINELSNEVPLLSAILPVAWQAMQLPDAAVDIVSQRLASKSENARIVAASWLLSNEKQRDRAIQTLMALEKGRPQTLNAQLARVVRWRTVETREVVNQRVAWLEAITKLPIASQAGPLFVVAEQEAAAGLNEEALEHYLAVALLYEHPAAVIKAARERSRQLLKLLGRDRDAVSFPR